MKAPFFAVSLLTSLSLCGVASAQLTKLTIGSNTLSGSGLPAWVAKDAGIFRKNGLDVQIVYFRGGTITAMGKEINAYQAEQFGVINLVVKAGSLQAEGQAWVSQLLAIEGAALGACKEFFRSTAHLSIEDTARHGVAFLVTFLAAKKS